MQIRNRVGFYRGRKMKAVIPAAGEGKRFNKDSTYMHKCLVPINGKALLLYTLENLTNIKEITE